MDQISGSTVIEVDVDAEPQVTSLDSNERKLARRLRIERRIENLRRQNLTEGAEIGEQKVQMTLLQQQLNRSTDLLEKLRSDGYQYTTDVRVTSVGREADRRDAEGINREKIIEQLESEAAVAQEMFHEVDLKWQKILKYDDPMNIHEAMNFQKEKCAELVKQKDGVIAMLREEIKEAERKFTNDQFIQNADVKTLAERIESQVMRMRKAYRDEMKLIEEVILVERKVLTEVNDKKWDDLYKKSQAEERSQMEMKLKQQEEFVENMNTIRIRFQEEYRGLYILQRNTIEHLQQEAEKLKMMVIMNSEKMDYNYQILKKREDENLIINSQQKRRINKLQDIVNELRKKIHNYDAETKVEISRLTAEVKNLQKCVVEIENKASALSKTNDLKHKQVWDLNVRDANAILNRILTIDRILHEQQLGLEWKKPDFLVLTKTDLSSYKLGTEILRQERERTNIPIKSTSIVGKAFVESNISMKKTVHYKSLLKHIFDKLSEKTGFLIEDKLNDLVAPYIEEEQSLVKVDNVLSALGVKYIEHIDLMARYFFTYAKCVICIKSSSSIKYDLIASSSGFSDKLGSTSTSPESERIDLLPLIMTTVNEPDTVVDEILGDVHGTADSLDLSSSNEVVDIVSDLTVASAITGKSVLSTVQCASVKHSAFNWLTCKAGHPLYVDPIYIIRALREFVSDFYMDSSNRLNVNTRLDEKFTTISRQLNEADVRMFWERYRDVFSVSKERLWNGLLVGLKEYYHILRDRKTLNDEVMALRKRNMELQYLLDRYRKKKEKKPPCARQREIPIIVGNSIMCRKL